MIQITLIASSVRNVTNPILAMYPVFLRVSNSDVTDHFSGWNFSLSENFKKIDQRHRPACYTCNRRRYRRATDTPAQRKYHIPVQPYIDCRSHNLYRHGIFRRTVQTNQHHAHALHEHEKQSRKQPEQITDGISFKHRAESEHTDYLQRGQEAP